MNRFFTVRSFIFSLVATLFVGTTMAHKGSSSCSCSEQSAATKTTCSPNTKLCSASEYDFTKAAKKKKKSKKRTKVAKKNKKRQTLSNYSYEKLKKEKEKLLTKGNKNLAVKFIEKMVPLCTDLGELAGLMLELADLLFDTGHLVKAERLYSEFVNLYPGDQKAEYASYKSILCSYWKTLDYFRDQSKTKETLDLVDIFLQRKEVFTTYQKEVFEIQTACREKLLESEINIFNFYLNRGDYLAANTRLENIEKEFLPILPDKEPVLLSLACDLALKENNQMVLEKKKNILTQKFPEYIEQKTIVAQATNIRSNVDKF